MAQSPQFPPADAKRVVFLGDSITYAGHYVAMIETQWLQEGRTLEVINMGLPSETCTGLSEPDHPFPRPNVHERLERCLEQVKPDILVACYGMNDGIYHPFSEQRFRQFQKGIQTIIDAANKRDVELVLMTPPPFDPLPMKKKGKLVNRESPTFAWFSIYENYDSEVLKPYSDWLLTLAPNIRVINLRDPILNLNAEKRKTNPDFVMSGDGVHIDLEGHTVLARTFLVAFGSKPSLDTDSELYKAVKHRQTIMGNAWLTKVGHKRPKMKAGSTLEDAREKTKPLSMKIAKLAKSKN